MNSKATRWFEVNWGKGTTEVDPPRPKPEPLRFNPEEGSAEAMLVGLIATWPETWPGLVFPDAVCRWLVISSTGPADLRGYAISEDGGTYRVALEAKVGQRDGNGVPKSAVQKALKQGIEGLKRIFKNYKDPDHTWLNVTPDDTRGAVVVACDGCGLSDAVLCREVEQAAKVADIKGLRFLRLSVVVINRYNTGDRRLVRSCLRYDHWFSV